MAAVHPGHYLPGALQKEEEEEEGRVCPFFRTYRRVSRSIDFLEIWYGGTSIKMYPKPRICFKLGKNIGLST